MHLFKSALIILEMNDEAIELTPELFKKFKAAKIVKDHQK